MLAAAGSGKTRVLTRRIAWRVNKGTASASYVLALTFTRKAASELRGRLATLGLEEPATAGTFHAVALSELRRLAAERGAPGSCRDCVEGSSPFPALPARTSRIDRTCSLILPPRLNGRRPNASRPRIPTSGHGKGATDSM